MVVGMAEKRASGEIVQGAEAPNDGPPPPLCVFCSAPWTDDMLKVYAQGDFDHGFYPGDFMVEGYDMTIDVTCSTCNRLVYRKEVRQDITIGNNMGHEPAKPGRVKPR